MAARGSFHNRSVPHQAKCISTLYTCITGISAVWYMHFKGEMWFENVSPIIGDMPQCHRLL